MTLKFFAKMLIPETALIIKRDGETIVTMFAEQVLETKLADAIIKDWTMSMNGPACTIEIK